MRYSATEERLLTIEEFQRLPDDGTRLDLVRGRVVRSPLPASNTATWAWASPRV